MPPVDDANTLAALDALIGRVKAAGPVVVSKGALAIQQAGMKRTKVRSGTLRRSWRVEVEANEGVSSALVGPTTVYARRQELGFKGPDKLGRVYHHDPGWPYVKPAFEITLPLIEKFAVSTYTAAIAG